MSTYYPCCIHCQDPQWHDSNIKDTHLTDCHTCYPKGEPMKNIPYRPDYLSGCDTDHLYLVTVHGEWPVYTCASEKEAITIANLKISEHRPTGQQVHITKIDVGSYREVQLVSIPAVTKLVPKNEMIEQLEEFST